jgi:hypothetical protein
MFSSSVQLTIPSLRVPCSNSLPSPPRRGVRRSAGRWHMAWRGPPGDIRRRCMGHCVVSKLEQAKLCVLPCVGLCWMGERIEIVLYLWLHTPYICLVPCVTVTYMSPRREHARSSLFAPPSMYTPRFYYACALRARVAEVRRLSTSQIADAHIN